MKDIDKLVPAMLALLDKMATDFAKQQTPYAALPWPQFLAAFNDYEHLERVAEWSTAGDDDE